MFVSSSFSMFMWALVVCVFALLARKVALETDLKSRNNFIWMKKKKGQHKLIWLPWPCTQSATQDAHHGLLVLTWLARPICESANQRTRWNWFHHRRRCPNQSTSLDKRIWSFLTMQMTFSWTETQNFTKRTIFHQIGVQRFKLFFINGAALIFVKVFEVGNRLLKNGHLRFVQFQIFETIGTLLPPLFEFIVRNIFGTISVQFLAKRPKTKKKKNCLQNKKTLFLLFAQQA